MNYIRTLRIVTLWETQNWLQINVVMMNQCMLCTYNLEVLHVQ